MHRTAVDDWAGFFPNAPVKNHLKIAITYAAGETGVIRIVKTNLEKRMNLLIKDRKDLSLSEVERMMELIFSIWPPDDGKTDIEKIIERHKNLQPKSFDKVIRFFLGNELIGHTAIFNREIGIETEKHEILALAGVCVRSGHRGKNLGKKLVKKAFEFVDGSQFNCSIFQTSVPKFYEKLECKQIQNTFINKKSKIDVNVNPWRDPYVMVYPKTYDLGNHIIDLNGDCY